MLHLRATCVICAPGFQEPSQHPGRLPGDSPSERTALGPVGHSWLGGSTSSLYLSFPHQLRSPQYHTE